MSDTVHSVQEAAEQPPAEVEENAASVVENATSTPLTKTPFSRFHGRRVFRGEKRSPNPITKNQKKARDQDFLERMEVERNSLSEKKVILVIILET